MDMVSKCRVVEVAAGVEFTSPLAAVAAYVTTAFNEALCLKGVVFGG